MKIDLMMPIDVQELSLRNRLERAHRVEQLRASVASRSYGVNSELVARGILREAYLDASSRQHKR
ncbi:MAG: flagellar biosynthesis anti-sigma factor FlgM [Thermoleophilia bacterium]